jgi:hypothetical protein
MLAVHRRLLNFLTVLPLLLFVAACVLWVRSYRFLDQYRYLDPSSGLLVDLVSLRGGIQVAVVRNVPNRDGGYGWAWGSGWSSTALAAFITGPPGDDWQLFLGAPGSSYRVLHGFRLLDGDLSASGGSPFWSVRIPTWAPAVTFATLPAAWTLRRTRRRRRLRAGHCPYCGYDLRATPDRCPECGAVTAPAG